MYVTGRFPLLVAIGVVPLMVLSVAGVSSWAVLLAWLLFSVAVACGDAAMAVNARELAVVRDGTTRARLGDRVLTGMWITNPHERTAHLTIRDAWQPTAGAPYARASVNIPGGERRHISVPLQPRRRGELKSAFVAIRSAGPLGIAGRQSVIKNEGTLRVLPPFTSRRHLASRVARLKELDGNTSLQVRGQGTEFDSLREYVRGDDVRSIDWRATARAATTMLRTWRPERDRHVVILIDTGRTSAARVGDATRLDAFLEAALLLTALAQRAGDHVHVVMFDRVVRARVSGVDGPRLLPAIVDAMAPIEAQLLDTNWDAAFAEIRTLTTRPSLVVLLTAQDSPDSARAFLGSLQSVTARSCVIVGSATHTALDDIAHERADIDGVYRAAAAEQTEAEARAVALAMERAGAEAISDTPEDLPPRVADRYLALKKLGRL